MGSCVSASPIERRILMLGLDGSGKTTILYRMKNKELLPTNPTIGFNVETVHLEGINVTYTIWDVGGQAKLRGLWRHYFMTAEGLIFVVDSCDEDRFLMAAHELRSILDDESMCGVPIIVFANKQDLEEAFPADEVTRRLRLSSLGSEFRWHVQSSSAVLNEGLIEGFEALEKMLSATRGR